MTRERWMPATYPFIIFLAPALIACSENRAAELQKKTPAPESAPASSMSPSMAGNHPGLLNPGLVDETAPPVFRVHFDTTGGGFVIQVTRSWAPHGADRLYNLARIGYYDDVAFFRVISGFMAQFGIHGDPRVSSAWRTARIPDDPVRQPNRRGFVSFATAGPDSRTTQLFINLVDNTRLDSLGFAPVGRVIEGQNVVDALYSGYGEAAPRGMGPRQEIAQAEGNAYFHREFPRLDYVKKVTLIP